METLVQDIRYSVRMLFKERGFSAVVLLTMALGIGMNTAIFSIVNAVIFRPLPFKDPEQLVFLWETIQQQGQSRNVVSLPDLQDWRKEAKSFESIGAYAYNLYNITGAGEPDLVQGSQVAAGFFDVLGVKPEVGRTFFPEEERSPVVVLSHALWERRFGGDPSVVGRAVTMSGKSYTVVGVMPASFAFPRKDIRLWTTYMGIYEEKVNQTNRGRRFNRVIARLGPGVSIQAAQAELSRVARKLEQQYPDTNAGVGASIVSMDSQTYGDIKPALLTMLGAVAFVLLIACANVANLLLARTTGRDREMAIRNAMGGSRGRIIRQLLTESIFLSLLGGAVGLLLAKVVLNLVVGLNPGNIPRLEQARIDGRVLVFTLIVSVLTGVIFGLAPSRQASKVNLVESLNEGGRGGVGGRRSRRAQSLLVVSEVALSLVLLIGAGLMGRSFLKILDINIGFNPRNLLTGRLVLFPYRYPHLDQQRAALRQILERVQALPGVESTGLCMSRPPDFVQSKEGFVVDGQPVPVGAQAPSADYLPISANYFKVMGITLLKGREFTDADQDGSPNVVIINESVAKRFFRNEDPIGKRIKIGDSEADTPWYSIVGVVGDVKYSGLDGEAGYALYFSYLQRPFAGMFLMVRTKTDPAAAISPIRGQIYSVDSELPIRDLKPIEELLSDAVAQPRFNTTLIVIFAAVALALAAIGIYGVIGYSVNQRTQEMGVRMALGAQRTDLLKMVLWQGVKLSILGIGIGVAVSLGLTRLITQLLFGLSAADPLTYVTGAAALIGVAAFASYVPAVRASRLHPMIALRHQ